MAVLAPGARGDLAAELVDHGLHAVADTQDRNPALVDPRGRKGGTRFVHAGGTTRQDDPFGIEGRHRLPRSIVGDDLAVYLALPDPPGDEAAVLRAEIDHQDGLTLHPGIGLFPGLLAALLPGDLEVRRDLQIVAGGNPVGGGLGGWFLGHIEAVSG